MIRFYFDFISPYAYLASTRIFAIAEKVGRDVELVPVLFAGLLGAHGTMGPAEVPARRSYMIRDLFRIAKAYGVPIEVPAAHPFNPLHALRLCSVDMEPSRKRALVEALYRATWVDGKRIGDPNVVREIATSLELDAELEAATSDAVKAKLRDATEDAVKRGIFGVPTIVVDGEMFWGCDSLPHLERFLASGEAVPPEWIARWDFLPAEATRNVSLTSRDALKRE